MSTLLDRLVDDAAVFPPGNAPLDAAIRDHRRHRSSAHASLIGPLLVRDTDVDGLPGLVDGSLAIGIIGTYGVEALGLAVATLEDVPDITVTGVEVALVSGADIRLAASELVDQLAALPRGVTVSVELPRSGSFAPDAWLAAADQIAAAGHQLKFRTGGTTPGAHPDEAELAAVLAALVPRRFKLTAGLHRAVRNTQPGTGFEQHGFLNVMVAVHRLLSGACAEEAAGVLADRDGTGLAATVRAWSEEDAAAVRATFRGFGCCGVAEPYDDLVGLGLA